LALSVFNPLGVIYKASREENNPSWPDIQILGLGIGAQMPNGESSESIGCFIFLKRPRSNGIVRLASNNPNDPPIVDPKYLTHPSDIDRLLDGNFAYYLLYVQYFHLAPDTSSFYLLLYRC
jgi:hypothetical protein